MFKLPYEMWSDIRVVIAVTLLVCVVVYVFLGILTHGFQRAKWVIYIPVLLNAIGMVIGVILLLVGKSGAVQHTYLGIFTYSLCAFIVTGILAILIYILYKKG